MKQKEIEFHIDTDIANVGMYKRGAREILRSCNIRIRGSASDYTLYRKIFLRFGVFNAFYFSKGE